MDFKPHPEAGGTRLEKYAPRAVPGVFLGYEVAPGRKWTGNYLCVELLNFDPYVKMVPLVHRPRVKEVYMRPNLLQVPFRAESERRRYAIVDRDTGAVPPTGFRACSRFSTRTPENVAASWV